MDEPAGSALTACTKGVYHITCVDSVSQWQIEACGQGISEAFLLSVLEMVMAQFPFEIVGFHSDNGSSLTSVCSVRIMDIIPRNMDRQ